MRHYHGTRKTNNAWTRAMRRFGCEPGSYVLVSGSSLLPSETLLHFSPRTQNMPRVVDVGRPQLVVPSPARLRQGMTFVRPRDRARAVMSRVERGVIEVSLHRDGEVEPEAFVEGRRWFQAQWLASRGFRIQEDARAAPSA